MNPLTLTHFCSTHSSSIYHREELDIELIQHIFTFCNLSEFGNLALVCRNWSCLSKDLSVQKKAFYQQINNILERIALGKKAWAKCNLRVNEIPLPDSIWEILTSKCPFIPNKIILQTHRLMFLPSAITNFTYFQHHINKHKYEFRGLNVEGEWDLSLCSLLDSHWLLIPKIIPEKSVSYYSSATLLQTVSYVFLEYVSKKQLPLNSRNHHFYDIETFDTHCVHITDLPLQRPCTVAINFPQTNNYLLGRQLPVWILSKTSQAIPEESAVSSHAKSDATERPRKKPRVEQ